jgi:flagellar motor switch protein FliN/FliY
MPRNKVDDPNSTEAAEHQFEEVVESGGTPATRLDFTDLGAVPLAVSADLGRNTMRIREILELREGSIVPLDKLAGEMTDVYVNGLLLARGEVVPIGDNLHVRIHEVIGAVGEDLSDEIDD